ncbi:Aflatoxin B1 aldehyde reductase member 2 [Geodia barretti]|nr:Aflatoxin B1 aldehyde reductase member 2 [Geodia barretti]
MYAEGKSEQVLGRYLNEKKPSKVVVATKANPWDNKTLSAASVRKQLETSLASLQSSCLDIFYLHAPDHTTPLEETLRAVNTLHEEGKFKDLALSNFASWEVAEAYHICKANGWVMPTLYQGMYNAITRMVEGELFPCLRNFGIRFYAYNPLAGGIMTGRYTFSDTDKKPEGRFFSPGNKWATIYCDRFWRKSVFDGLDLVRAALDESYGVGQVAMISAALRWLNHHSQLSPDHGDAIIIGASKMEHLVSNLEACEEGPLDKRVVEAFDKAWMLDKGNCPKYYR